MIKLKEYCGIFGIYNKKEAANYVYLGLHALQHRGQEAAGIVSTQDGQFFEYKGYGLVNEVFNQESIDSLKGKIAIGHNRYSTFGDDSVANIQPLSAQFDLGRIAIAHNGNIVNANQIKQELVKDGAIFNSNSDTEVIIHLIARSSKSTFFDRLKDALRVLKGAFSLIVMREDAVYAIRDPWGFRPLSMGKLDDAAVFASETCAFDLIGAEFIRDIKPGEIVVAGNDGVKHYENVFQEVEEARCVFEYIYFSRPDSYLWGKNIYSIRKKMGEVLAEESPVEADIVIPTPDSGVPAALGYSQKSNIPFDFGLIRNHYVGRTFIEPAQSIRHFGVRLKLNPARDVLNNKRVVVIDDSIVRGTTSKRIVKMLKGVGAKEVHIRIASPPVVSPCFYGIDTPMKKELIASSHSIDEIRKYSTADSVAYLSLDGLKKVVGDLGYCFACFNGQYPIDFDK
jgi:amidophosphoribosyltransferase